MFYKSFLHAYTHLSKQNKYTVETRSYFQQTVESKPEPVAKNHFFYFL